MAFDSLPPEIWSAIVDHLPLSDQLCISQASPQLCAVARRIIYRSVELRSNDSATQATLALLSRDYSVARAVKRLHIHTTLEATTGPAWFDADALAGMAHLYHLELTGLPFHTEDEQLKFNNTISKSLKGLKKLEYSDGETHWLYSTTHTPCPEAHVPVLWISGLQEIVWSDHNAFIPSSPILTPIHASRETLTHIRIPVPADIATYESLTQFFSFRFPCLSTLYLGGWSTTLAVPVGAAFTTFLVAHPLIEDLHLGFWECWNELHCRISPDIVLGPSTLPNLRRLTVDAFNLGVFVRSGMSSLKLLETLHIGSGYLRREDEGVGFAEMYRALEAYGGLPQLKALRLTLEGLNDEGEDAHWIAGLGRLCPKVERLWGNYNVWWTAIWNRDVFASYHNLRSQVMPDPGLCNSDMEARMRRVQELVLSNVYVTDLQFYSEGDIDAITFHYQIGRDAEGRITEVLENGMKIV